MKEEEKKVGEGPLYAYLVTKLIQNSRIFARRLPVLELSVKDAYDELEIVLV
jgi:hypothetical protein